MERLFGAKSIISIPPYDVFNNDTIKAMGHTWNQNNKQPVQQKKIGFYQNRTIFVANGSRATTTTTTNS